MSAPFAVVTGASSGIGKSLAEFLLSRYWNVCHISRSLDKMQDITAKYNSSKYLNIKCDLNDANDCKSACDRINTWCDNTLNVLVNNAGDWACNMETESDKSTVERWDYTMNLNVRAPYIFTKYLLSSLKNASAAPLNNRYDGCIINMSSGLSQMQEPAYTPYIVSKSALDSFTRCTALEFSKYKIRVNALTLGVFDTPILVKGGMSVDEAKQFINKDAVNVHPIGRIGDFNDVNQMVLFLSDKTKSGFTTGSLIKLDGGQTLIACYGNPNNNEKL